MVHDDEKHSANEKRFYVLGHTDPGRLLFVVFTIRNRKIRIISARDMSRKEREIYRNYEKNITAFKNEDEERNFWASHDSIGYIDWNKAERLNTAQTETFSQNHFSPPARIPIE